MRNKKNICIFISLTVVLIAVFLFSLFGGVSFFYPDADTLLIIRQIRLPRVLMAIVTGAALAASGCVFQGILRNPLADPFTLGISGGAAFGASCGFVFGLTFLGWFFIPLCAFAGALLSVSIVYFLNSGKRFNSNSMILSGVIISYIFSSAVMLVYVLSSAQQIQNAFMWLMGSFSNFDERLLPFVFIVIILGTAILCLSGNIINAVALGGDKSETLGIDTQKTIKIIFLTASLITACAVSVCGVIGFVGLMMPHIMRKIIGSNHALLIPVSALAGAVFLPLCDSLARMLFAPVIIPVGVVTSIIGGIFFIFLFIKSNRTAL
ncbi:FecCD family ABC transporter permease [Endomicrobium proavitum]|uniref:FecCD family ABC transporter permease n=1 Tax=Endomicrobium proavitum TaxID=1408281 RepID=UPI000698E0E7|nr:iron ABC transporter permease [Endomicrobium proavitum]